MNALELELRALSDSSIGHITGIATPAIWAIMRNAMYALAIDYVDIEHIDIDVFLADFIRIIDVKRSIIRTCMDNADAQSYVELFNELKAAGKIDKDVTIVNITQAFDPTDTYIGAWYTCALFEQQLKYFWIFVDVDWDAAVYSAFVEIRDCLRRISLQFSFITYGNVAGFFPQVMSGTYNE